MSLLLQLSAFVAWLPTATAGVRPVSPVVTPHRTRALDLGVGWESGGLDLELDTTDTDAPTEVAIGIGPPILMFRWGFAPKLELVLGDRGLGLRGQVWDGRDGAIPLVVAVGGHAAVASTYSDTSAPVRVAPGGSLHLGAEWSVAPVLKLRPYAQVQVDAVEEVYLAVSDLSQGTSSSGFWTPDPELTATIMQPRMHVLLAVDLPIEAGRTSLVPGLGVGVPIGLSTGEITMAVCESCAVGVDSVSARPGISAFFVLRLEPSGPSPRASSDATSTKDSP